MFLCGFHLSSVCVAYLSQDEIKEEYVVQDDDSPTVATDTNTDQVCLVLSRVKTKSVSHVIL